MKGRDLKLSILALDLTIARILVQEDDNDIECVISYLSWILNDAEIRYSAIEKLSLCMYYSCTKLKHYIKSFNVQVSSQ